MSKSALLGPWVKRFLLDHLITERNLSRNTQRSYRDSLALLLPYASAQNKKPIDQLEVPVTDQVEVTNRRLGAVGQHDGPVRVELHHNLFVRLQGNAVDHEGTVIRRTVACVVVKGDEVFNAALEVWHLRELRNLLH